MEKILNYQKTFFNAIFNNDYKILQKSIGKIEDLDCRFNIYSNNVFSSLKRVLKEDFPYCVKSVGEIQFNQASFEFIRNFPPTSGCLMDYGKNFPSFLGIFFPMFPYLEDIARIEWAKRELYYKEDSSPLNPQELQNIPTDKYLTLSFEFPKAIAFFKFPYSLKETWQKIECGSQMVKDHSATPSFCLIIRPTYKVQHYWLSAEDFCFLEVLYDRHNLAEAYDMAIIKNPKFNLSEALVHAFQREYFTKVTISHENKTDI